MVKKFEVFFPKIFKVQQIQQNKKQKVSLKFVPSNSMERSAEFKRKFEIHIDLVWKDAIKGNM